jgi:hypothetical protein
MAAFGLRKPRTAPGAPPPALPEMAFIYLAAFAVMAALTASLVWFSILQVPLERPVGPLFGTGPASREGWAMWYAAPLLAAGVTPLLFWLYFRRAHRWTLLGLTLAGAIAIMLGATSAFWAKNIGYTWYFVPNATIAAIISVQPQMFGFAFGRAAGALIQQMAYLPLLGAAFGFGLGVAASLPWRYERIAEPSAPPHRTGWTARIVTTAIMTLFVTTVAAAQMPSGAVLVAPLVAWTWWRISFRDGGYEFINVLKGSAILGLVSTVPFVLALTTVHGFDGATLLLGIVTRTPVYLLISVIAIKIAVALSKATSAAAALAFPTR